MATLLNQLVQSMHDELDSLLLLSLTLEEGSYYNPKEPIWGKDFEDKFPSAQYDLEQASKCYALSLSRACVCHLMRLTEAGIRATARWLSIPDPLIPAEKNWAIILKSIKSAGEAKWPFARDKHNNEDAALFDRLYASIDAIRTAWRNPTMHLGNKYTEKEAKHIFEVVGGLMKLISARMDEKGAPLV